ncbi:MAG TPA: hypothetical protein VIK05_03460 [Ilumatobacteraceae bacterium]
MNDHGKHDRDEGDARTEGPKSKPPPKRANPKGKADRAQEKRSPEMERADVANGENQEGGHSDVTDPPLLPG